MVYQILIESRRIDFLIVIGYCLIVHQQESYFFVFMENDYPWGENPLIRFVIISVSSFFFFSPCSSVFSLVIGSLSVSRPFWLSGARNGQSDKLHPFNPTVSQTLGGLKPLGDVSMLGFV